MFDDWDNVLTLILRYPRDKREAPKRSGISCERFSSASCAYAICLRGLGKEFRFSADTATVNVKPLDTPKVSTLIHPGVLLCNILAFYTFIASSSNFLLQSWQDLISVAGAAACRIGTVLSLGFRGEPNGEQRCGDTAGGYTAPHRQLGSQLSVNIFRIKSLHGFWVLQGWLLKRP
eukprot:1196393-Prorocentrum_minimum.AAC.7